MIEYVEALHSAFHTESRWLFILYIALIGFVVAGALGYVVQVGYERQLREQAANAKPSDPVVIKVRDTTEEDRLHSEVQRLEKQLAERGAAQKAAQEKISIFLDQLNGVRAGWQPRLGQSEEVQTQSALEAKALHEKIGNYLNTLPRGNIYRAKLNTIIPSTMMPEGMNIKLSGWWNILQSDSQRLTDFLNDPEFGKP